LLPYSSDRKKKKRKEPGTRQAKAEEKGVRGEFDQSKEGEDRLNSRRRGKNGRTAPLLPREKGSLGSHGQKGKKTQKKKAGQFATTGQKNFLNPKKKNDIGASRRGKRRIRARKHFQKNSALSAGGGDLRCSMFTKGRRQGIFGDGKNRDLKIAHKRKMTPSSC